MKNKTNMAELMKQVTAYGQPQNLNEEVLDEAKATLSRFGGDRLKSSIMNLAKQKGHGNGRSSE